MNFQTQISNIFSEITGREPLEAYNNGKTGKAKNRTVKLLDATASAEELKKLDEAYRLAFPDRFIRVRNMVGTVYGHGTSFKEPKVVVTFTH